MEIIKIVTLSLSSLLLLFVGIMRLTNPVETYLNSSGIKLENDTDLLNEIRGLSAVMFCGGIIVGLGAVVPGLTLTSHVVGALIFVGFAIGRLIGIGVDGRPNKQLMQGIWFEIILGGANVFGLISIF